MNKKYIIELEDEPFVNDNPFDDEELWRVKGFNSLVFDQNGLDKLTEFDENKYDFDEVYDEAYKNGLNDAWEVAKRIIKSDGAERQRVFGDKWPYKDICDLSASEVIAKLKAYEEKIEVGDEVTFINGEKGVVIGVYNDELRILTEHKQLELRHESQVTKTGRHFSEVAQVLQKLKE